MAGFDPQNIRNIVVVGHKASGKTSLVEAMLYVGGATQTLGSVFNKTSILDDEVEEQARSATLQTSVANIVWRKTKINVLDTPGEGGLFGDTRAAMGAADAVMLIISAKDGVQPMTERVNNWAIELGIPRYVVFTKCDLEHVQIAPTLEAVKKRLKIALAPLQQPIGEGTAMNGVVELLRRKAYVGKDGPAVKAVEVPADLKDALEKARGALVDEVASTDDALTEKYLESGDLSDEEMTAGLHKAVADGKAVTTFFVGSLGLFGIASLLDAIVDIVPDPTKRVPFRAKGEGEPRACTKDGPLAAYCFKTTIDPHAGRASFVRVISGVLKSDGTVVVGEQKERVGALVNAIGKPTGAALGEVYAGDIVAITKLKAVKTGDVLCDERKPFDYAVPEPPPALFSRVIVMTDRGSGEKIVQGLTKLSEEDASLKLYQDEQTHEQIVAGLSQLHLDVTIEKMKRRFGLDTVLGPPRIPYLETVSRKATGIEGKHKKQSGGHGQFGVCYVDMEPTARGAGFVFDDAIVGGAIPRNFIPSVEKGIVKAAKRGFLAGFQVIDFKVRLYDGKYHDVDSSDAAFQIAGSRAFKAAMEKAGPTILEPLVKMEITVPTANLGDVMGDLNGRRGRILGTDSQGEFSVVNALAPLVEVLEYEPKLRALTQGSGTFTMTMDRYEPVPANLQDKIIKDSGFKAAADEE